MKQKLIHHHWSILMKIKYVCCRENYFLEWISTFLNQFSESRQGSTQKIDLKMSRSTLESHFPSSNVLYLHSFRPAVMEIVILSSIDQQKCKQ